MSYILVEYEDAYKCASEMRDMADAIAQACDGRADLMAFAAKLMAARDKLLRETAEYKKHDDMHLNAHYQLIGGGNNGQ